MKVKYWLLDYGNSEKLLQSPRYLRDSSDFPQTPNQGECHMSDCVSAERKYRQKKREGI